MTGIGKHLSTTTLSANGLGSVIQRCDQLIQSSNYPLLPKDTSLAKLPKHREKGWKSYHLNQNHIQVSVTTLIYDKVDFKHKLIRKRKQVTTY